MISQVSIKVTALIITNIIIDLGVDVEEDENGILRFWQRAENKRNYPVLAAIARDYLAIPAAGVGVERLFNAARDICTYRRFRLRADTIRDLMMTMHVNRFDHHAFEDMLEDSARDDHSTNYGDESESDGEVEEDIDILTGFISEGEDGEATESSSSTREPSLPPMRAVSSSTLSRPRPSGTPRRDALLKMTKRSVTRPL